jgi:hypothetical protein
MFFSGKSTGGNKFPSHLVSEVNTISERREKMKKIAVILAVVCLMMAAPDVGYCFGHWTGNVGVDIVSEQGEVLNTIPHKNYEGGGTQVIKKYL